MTDVRKLIALTRDVSPAMAQCELTHLSRVPIDVGLARAQHDNYEKALHALGCDVQRLPSGPDMPDAVFIEDTAVVLDELAILTRPGAESRWSEIAAVEAALAPFRALARVEAPGTIDGGDVLVAGRTLFIGLSGRTNGAAIEQVRTFVAPYGYLVQGVGVTGCLHLKSAATVVAEGVLLVNPAWVPLSAFQGAEILEVDPGEPSAANVVRVGGRLLYPSEFPRTGSRLSAGGFDVTTVDVGELAKAEGAVTCCSLIFTVEVSAR
jgi:dimethylargininase